MGSGIKGTIVAVSISKKKGIKKDNVPKISLKIDHGVENDAHAGKWHRQVSLLAEESIAKMIEMGVDVGPGDFAENITTKGLHLFSIPVGTRLKIGPQVEVEVTQIGKTCHEGCAIKKKVGDCVFPREGIFTKVLVEGEIKAGDDISALD